ncbi:hypothetical protein TRFO_23900 [Tritrichomonas foetus]|uniref:Uncharacterized protein n=1 Tax=Tritrichomonas foetus TaxID=1144522 RepID=A0A1J4K993_9EUKA|nr:hypothetical protein TRFO_23900 [Tritrichomonas foetus]|eukprot:OHT07787.1 hypothetical protein TRFO_23900 [Tritrichomonas foetus]
MIFLLFFVLFSSITQTADEPYSMQSDISISESTVKQSNDSESKYKIDSNFQESTSTVSSSSVSSPTEYLTRSNYDGTSNAHEQTKIQSTSLFSKFLPTRTFSEQGNIAPIIPDKQTDEVITRNPNKTKFSGASFFGLIMIGIIVFLFIFWKFCPSRGTGNEYDVSNDRFLEGDGQIGLETINSEDDLHIDVTNLSDNEINYQNERNESNNGSSNEIDAI